MIGGSGMVGSATIPCLLAAGHTVDALVRRPLATRPGQKQHVAPSERWPEIIAALQPEIGISALGTTLRDAGSQAQFAAVDKQLLLDCAAAALHGGAQHMVSVSSVGANPRSGNFYLRTKGEVEDALGGMGFARLDLIRPGLLLGKRAGPLRLGERLGMLVAPVTNLLTLAPWDRYRAIRAARVAEAITRLTERDNPGIFIHHYREIGRLTAAD